MSSLQFLNKKSWHVNTKKNEEKVWLRQQAAAKEALRVAELQKQLNEERKLEEIQRLERESGRSTAPPRAPRIDWMYEGPGAAMPGTAEAVATAVDDAKKKQEDALLGRTAAAMPPAAAEGVAGIGKGDDGSPVVDDDSIRHELSLRDAEAKLREDPLLVMKRRQAAEVGKLSAAAGSAYVAVRGSGRSRRPPVAAAGKLTQAGPLPNATEALRKAERAARKEQRAQIRDERRRRREGAASEKRGGDRLGGDMHGDDNARMASRNWPHGLDTTAPSADYPGTKRASQEEAAAGAASIVEGRARTDAPDGNGFGLCVPAGGTRVEVQKQFVPGEGTGRGSVSIPRPGAGKLPPRAPRRSQPLPAAEVEQRLASMQADADSLTRERAVRLEQHRRIDDHERRRQHADLLAEESGPGFMRKFAQDAIDKAGRDAHSRRVR